MTQYCVIEEKVTRMWLYRFLGKVYSYPDESLTEILWREELWPELRMAAGVLSTETGKIIDEIEASIRQCNGGGAEQLLQELRIEYTYLFINAVPRVQAPPYESVYLGRGLLMGPPVSEVLGSYREAGLVMNDDYDSLPDHISAELEFMFYLMQKEVECERSGQAEQVEVWQQRKDRFLADHLLRWQALFFEKVKKNARKPFYRLISELTQVILDSENKLMAKSLNS
ncbi:molecular chaperone [Chloroflexota bacterium]